MIDIRGLTKHYDDVVAVNDLDLAVGSGEVLGLVGPNGSGKTTTMRCLCGIIPPTGGEIVIDGTLLALDPIACKKQIAFVPADPKLFDYLTVREHLAFFARLYEMGDQKNEAEQLLTELEIIDKADRLPGALSRGMQQKLMIACALIHKPRVLVFDEPFTGLDPQAIRTIKRMLAEYADTGAAVIVSSHLLALVDALVDRVAIIKDGHKIAHGTKSELAAGMPQLQGRDDLDDLEEIFLAATTATAPTQTEEPSDDTE